MSVCHYVTRISTVAAVFRGATSFHDNYVNNVTQVKTDFRKLVFKNFHILTVGWKKMQGNVWILVLLQ